MCQRLAAADGELNEYFTTSFGVSAQPYEPSTSCGFDSAGAHASLVLQSCRGMFRRFDKIAATVARVEQNHRETIALVYGNGAGTFAQGSKEVALDVGKLVIALTPTWGHGSFLALAARQERAHRAFDKKGGAATILDFLELQADRGDETKSWFAKLRSDCEAVRRAALAAYDLHRLERVRLEREEARLEEARRNAEFEERLGRRRRREAERFEARLRGVS